MRLIRLRPPNIAKAVNPINNRKNPHTTVPSEADSMLITLLVTATMAEIVLNPWAGMQSRA